MKAKPVCTLVAKLESKFLTLVTLLALALPAARAQETAPAPVAEATPPPALATPVAPAAIILPSTNTAPKKLKTVVVTGSMIATADAVPIAPVIAITAEDIAKFGASTLSDVMKHLPQNRGSLDDKFQNGFAPGSSEVSLRGLGAKYTLVLLNGHRVAPFGFGQGISDSFTDLNSLPTSAIERIEILPEGASSIYGSDAVAGVVNIILRKDFVGTELSARVGNTFKSDMFEQNYSLTAGFADKKHNNTLLVNVEYYHRDSLGLKDRSYSRSADHTLNGGDYFLSDLGPNPGYFFTLGGQPIRDVNGDILVGGNFTVDPAGSTPGYTDGGTGDSANYGRNSFDYNPYLNAIPEARRYGVLLSGQHTFNENVDFLLETDYHNSWAREIAAPTPITGNGQPSLFGNPGGYQFVVAANNPYNRFGEPLTFRYRLLEAGPRINEVTTETFRIVPGFNFHLANEWEASASFNFNVGQSRDKGFNYLSADAVQNALNGTDPATALNVFAPLTNYAPGMANNPALIESLKTRTYRQGDSYLAMGEAVVKGPLFQLPGGKLRLAVGGDGRHEAFEDVSDPLSSSEHIVSSGTTQGKGHRDVGAIFAELMIPLFGEDNAKTGVRALDLDISARLDQYSDFGSTINPKYAIKYSPREDLVFRASYGTGFRAPSLRELYLGDSISYQSLRDPDTNSIYYGRSVEYRVLTAGNPQLTAETSESFSASMVYEPKFIKGLSLTAGWGKIGFKNAISQKDPNDILAYNASQVQRDPLTHEILTISNVWNNAGSTETEFVDMGATYEVPSSWGTFTFEANFSWQYSYLFEYQDNLISGDLTSPLVNKIGQAAGLYNHPEWSGNGSLFWNYKRFTGGVTVNWIDSFRQSSEYSSVTYPGYFTRSEVDDWVTVDLQATYEFPKDLKMTLGVQNVADEPPPFSASESEGYNLGFHNPVGRYWYLQVTKKF